MGKSGPRRRIILAPKAERDIQEVLMWSRMSFGEGAEVRYARVLKQGLRDIASDPARPGSAERSELGRGVRSYHLWFSRERARNAGGFVRRPRHFLVYRVRGEMTIEVIRLLHDARELERHMPEEPE